jgi:hypothetical protein
MSAPAVEHYDSPTTHHKPYHTTWRHGICVRRRTLPLKKKALVPKLSVPNVFVNYDN